MSMNQPNLSLVLNISNKMYAVFGDSYISWLNRFNVGCLHNFHGRCKLYGVSGMSTTRKFEPEFQKMLQDRPRYVFNCIILKYYAVLCLCAGEPHWQLVIFTCDT